MQGEVDEDGRDLAIETVPAHRALDTAVGPKQQHVEFLDDQHASTL